MGQRASGRAGRDPGVAAAARLSVDAGDQTGREPTVGPEELETYLHLWDIAERIEPDDEFEVARSAHFRAEFWSDMERGGRARESAIRDLLRGLLDWLEEPPSCTVEELMALARQEPTWDLADAMAQAVDRENLRHWWIPRLRAALNGHAEMGRAHGDDGGRQ